MHWTVVIPVKPPAIGKSRLGLGPELARAIALETVAAVVACTVVDRVIVVTADAAFRPPDVEVLLENAPSGIDAAVAAGAALAGIDAARAALLGDLPALVPEELAAALALAALAPRSFVADHDGTGTTLVTAAPGVELRTAFGPDSAARHRGLGLAALDVPVGSSVRFDVDTRDQFEAARAALHLAGLDRPFMRGAGGEGA
ncbi:MAG TPA: 2-phospho-L-lactate guanylyltransferase, partial [Pseudolysinimonas sp.]|nr:2-phospho-L-lactate guanylyltransferase [Pseudolysinimonas sp.]